MPTFGRDTIRKISSSASEQKKMAARDYEDYLQVYLMHYLSQSHMLIIFQCSMPVFEGLFPSPFNNIILDLLYILSTWHALAKLRMHTDRTLKLLGAATTSLGVLLRRFVSQVCKKVKTFETDRERNARVDRQSKNGATSASSGKKERTFNLLTYKLHALGDYVPSIQSFGSSDNWSTLRVSALDT
jgi:hypothetical protein